MSKVKPNYFSHDLHARSDKDILKLRMKYGMEGVGVYWCIVEMLHEEGGHILRSEYERISFELRTNNDTITSIIEDFQLFKFDDEKFWSESALRRINEKKEKSALARESISKRWGNTNVLRSNNDSNTIKGNEIKVNKKNISNPDSLTNTEKTAKNEKTFVNFKAQGEELLFDRYTRHTKEAQKQHRPSSGREANS